MKKLALTIAIVLTMSLGAYAQRGSGLFQYGMVSDEEYYGAGDRTSTGDFFSLGLPGHEDTKDQYAPLGSGALLLIGFGAAYAMKKRREK